MWQHWINFILGIILLILAYTGIGTTTLVIMSILVILFSLWGGLAGNSSGARRVQTQ
jgi:hypothetical protein